MLKKPPLAVSVIVPTRNRVQKLARLLRSLAKLHPVPHEIIIVNDGSHDATPMLLTRWESLVSTRDSPFPLKVVINNPVSRGPAYARNQAIRVASQPLVAFTDDEAVVIPEWVDLISRRMRAPVFRPQSRLCGVGGQVLPLRQDLLSQYYADQRILDPPRRLAYLVTVNACFRKQCLEEVGLFDTSFPAAGGEDTDLCLRLHAQSYRFARERRAVVYHDYSANFWDFCKLWVRYGKWTQKAVQKRGGCS